MGSPYLSTNETIILSAHDLVINTIPAEAILTSQRLMLVDKIHPRILPQDIRFTAIETVTTGENADSDPAFSLSIITPDGTRQPLEVIFPQKPRGDRTVERDEWATRIRGLSQQAQEESGVIAMELRPPFVPGEVPEAVDSQEPGEDNPARPRIRSPSLSERRNKAAGASRARTIGIVALTLIVVAIVAAGIVFFAPSLLPLLPTPATQPPVPTVTATATPVPTPSPTETQAPVPTPEVTVVSPQQEKPAVPQTGIWVHVVYDGRFTGTAGPPGRFRDIAGSGDQFYQLSAKDEIVFAYITKPDNSGNPLTVEIYDEGEMVKAQTITKPGGTLEISAEVGNP
ncbi:MAG: hypothetical protein GX651_02360 [Methanomicrobiales archaeon]|nr:hypothetical protein [Methanomicrobiales archaeon]